MVLKQLFIKLWRWTVLISLVGIMATSYAETPTIAKEYQVKAVFLYNFNSYIVWPETVFANNNDPLQICVLGEDPFSGSLDRAVENQKTKTGHPLVVQRLTDMNAITQCHILFVSKSEQTRLKKLFAVIKELPILTVSDIEDFIQKGGMIEFYNQNDKVRLSINPDVLEQVGLKADANLLRLSKIVRTTQE